MVIVKRLFYRGTGGSGTIAPRYSHSFNNSGSWTLSGDSYFITVPRISHDKGVTPTATVYEEVSLQFEQVNTSISVSDVGDITISVSSTPDNRFNGRIIII